MPLNKETKPYLSIDSNKRHIIIMTEICESNSLTIVCELESWVTLSFLV